MKSLNTVILSAVLLTSLAATAGRSKSQVSEDQRKHLTIGSVETHDLTYLYKDTESNTENAINAALERKAISEQAEAGGLQGAVAQLTAAEVVVDKIINIGTKIWNVIEKGRPVANYSAQKATALPQNARRWDQLQNWQRPTSRVQSVVYKNLYGIEVVRFTYRVISLYGGDVSGIGRYIGYATVEPLEMTVAFMYTFNANTKVDAVYNMGSAANPVAGMLMNVNWTVSTVLKTSTKSHSYTLDGRGNIQLPQNQGSLSALR
jgi:hypothetical protein